MTMTGRKSSTVPLGTRPLHGCPCQRRRPAHVVALGQKDDRWSHQRGWARVAFDVLMRGAACWVRLTECTTWVEWILVLVRAQSPLNLRVKCAVTFAQ